MKPATLIKVEGAEKITEFDLAEALNKETVTAVAVGSSNNLFIGAKVGSCSD